MTTHTDANPYLELHITVQPERKVDEAELRAYLPMIGWEFSKIENDIILGPGSKLYATKHMNWRTTSPRDAQDTVLTVIGMLEANQFKVIRGKVEVVQFDRRFKEETPR